MDLFKAFGISKISQGDMLDESHWAHPRMDARTYQGQVESGEREAPTHQAYYDKLRDAIEGDVRNSLDNEYAMGPLGFQIMSRMSNDPVGLGRTWEEFNARADREHQKHESQEYHPFARSMNQDVMRRMYPHQFETAENE